MYAQRNLRFPCSGCVHLLCVPLLCVSALCACVWCACTALACPRFASQSARLHRAALVDVADTTFLEDPGDLTCPFDDRPDTYSPCLCSFLDPLQRTDPLDFDKQCCPRGRFDHLIGMAQLFWLSILNFISPFASLRRKYTRSRPPFPLHSTSPGASFLPPLLFCACPHMPALSNTKNAAAALTCRKVIHLTGN